MKYLGNYSLSTFLKLLVNVIWYLQIILFGFLLIVITAQVTFKTDRIYSWPVDFADTVSNRMIKNGAGITEAKMTINNGTLRFKGANNWQNISITFIGLSIAFGTFLLITYQLRKILSSFVSDHPFIKSNILRIRLIGLILIVASALKFVFSFFYTNYINSAFEGFIFTNKLEFAPLLSGLLILIIAEIFRIGVNYREENDLTI